MTYIATGNTFPAREALKFAGFAWNKETREWTGDDAAYAKWGKITQPTYGMAYRRGLGGYKIEARNA